eukprot:NODE_2709_length_2160_cov_7.481062.p1 GENE.NODE_2709_length_2160_cov_7.481062~~NODE_2709_length_2160_cov_7.481062.p1  ORF type:complete len:609 (-),score=130.62 NODE_2709_length_2160_cov_7.481062:232-2058(-)
MGAGGGGVASLTTTVALVALVALGDRPAGPRLERATAQALSPPVPELPSGISPYYKQFELLGATRLQPGQRGTCWFHSVRRHGNDRHVFQLLGGTVSDCVPRSLTAATHSEAVLCNCVAPTAATAFDQHFVELGASDGQFISNSLFFEAQMGWTGLLIEGSPEMCPALREGRTNSVTVCAVVGPDVKTATFYSFMKRASWLVGMSCLQGSLQRCTNKDTAQIYAWSIGAELVTSKVPFRSLGQLLVEHNMTRLAWMSIDVEGAEQLVFSTIDFTRLRADIVSYEGRDLLVDSLLQSQGYARGEGPESDNWWYFNGRVPAERTLLPSVVHATEPFYARFADVYAGPLKPGEPGQCWFHMPSMDAKVFQGFGGILGMCAEQSVQHAAGWSPALLCQCVAPLDPMAYGRHFVEVRQGESPHWSFSLFLEAQLGWTGLIIESNPILAEQLRLGRPRSITLNAVLENPVGKSVTFYVFTPRLSRLRGAVAVCRDGSDLCKNQMRARRYARQTGTKMSVVHVVRRHLGDIMREHGLMHALWLDAGSFKVQTSPNEAHRLLTLNFTEVHAGMITYRGFNTFLERFLHRRKYRQLIGRKTEKWWVSHQLKDLKLVR